MLAFDPNDPGMFADLVPQANRAPAAPAAPQAPLRGPPRAAPEGYQPQPGGLAPIPGGPADPNRPGGPLDPESQMSPDSIDMQADLYLRTNQLPPLGIGGAGGARQRIMNRAAEMARAASHGAGDLATQAANYRALRATLDNQQRQLGNIQSQESTASRNLDALAQVSHNLPGSTEMPLVNRLERTVQRNFNVPGHQEVSAYDVAYSTAINEYARLISMGSSGNGQLTDAARSEAQSMIPYGASPSQLDAAIHQARIDMANRRSSYEGTVARLQAQLAGRDANADQQQGPGPVGAALNAMSDAIWPHAGGGQGSQGGPPMPGPGGGLPPGGPPGGPGGGGAGPQGMDLTSQTIMNPSQTPRGLGDGATRLEEDPRLRAVAGRLGSMLANTRVGDDQILGFMQQAGVNPADTSIQSILAYRNTPAFARWQRSHPNQAYPIDNTFFTREVQQSPVEHAASWAANSPAGAYAANAGDAVTFGTLDNMTSDPAQTRASMDALRGQYPGSSLAGTVSGSALGMGALEGGAANLGARGVWAARGADALYGGAYGAGSADDGNRVVGGLEGALAGLGGGAVGRTVQRGAGRVLTGARDEATRFLTDRGIPLTLGQMAGRGGVVGRTIAGLEDKLQSIPLLGDAIRARRQTGVQAFNRAAFDESLDPIGQRASAIAEPGVEDSQRAVSGAYDQALNGAQIPPDNIFLRDWNGAMQQGARLPGNMADEFRFTIANKVMPELRAANQQGGLTGEGYQAIRQALRQDRAAMQGTARAHDFAQAIRRVEASLESLVRRQAPDVVEGLNQADQAYARSQVVRSAVSAGKNTGGVFTPAQLGQAAEANARRFGGNQATTNRPFFDLQRNAQDVLPSTVPNSGTADRAMAAAVLPGVAGLAGYETGLISPEHAAMLTAFGLPYTQAGQRTLQTLIARRPDLLRRMGEAAIRTQRVGGTLGRSAAIPMLPSYSGQ